MAEAQPALFSDLIATGELPPPQERLTAEEKEQLAAEGTPFTITEVQYGSDPEFGAFWHVRIELDGHETGFNLGSHIARDEFMEKLQALVGRQPVAGVRLNGRKARNGKTFFTIEAAT